MEDLDVRLDKVPNWSGWESLTFQLRYPLGSSFWQPCESGTKPASWESFLPHIPHTEQPQEGEAKQT